MNKKQLLVLILTTICFKSVQSSEADWEILNLAIRNPSQANPQILSNSILNILNSFGSSTSATTQVQTSTSPVTQTSTTSKPCPVCSTPSPSLPAPPSPSPSLPPPSSPPQITFHPIYIPAPPSAPSPAPQVLPGSYHLPAHHQQQIIFQEPRKTSKASLCGTHENSLADFLVNVPCPTTTTTPKPIRQIVVKVPCPTTTSKPECQCQCCPCNPCPSLKPKPSKPSKPSRTTKKCIRKESSESRSEETIYKSYDPVMKKYVNTKKTFHPFQTSDGEYLWK